jgi:UDP-N-acetyl-D-mannosaminuronate dehydrogenase
MRKIAAQGLGYGGLPVAVGFAEHFPGTIGFDIDTRRIAALAGGDQVEFPQILARSGGRPLYRR